MIRCFFVFVVAILAGCATPRPSQAVREANAAFAQIERSMNRESVYESIGLPTAVNPETFKGLDQGYRGSERADAAVEQWLVEGPGEQYAELVLTFAPDGEILAISRSNRFAR